MNVVTAELHPVKWSRTRWLTLIALVFAAHVVLIFAFGQRKQIVPPIVTTVPRLQLANNSDALLALNDPTLFAAPNPKDIASAVWLQVPVVRQPSFRFPEPPRYLLAPDAENLGATFSRFMQTNRFAGFQLDLKPPPELSAPVLPLQPVFAEKSTLQIEGDLAQRKLLSPITLTNWPFADVLAPSVVQVLVDASGNVVSTILLPPDNGVEAAARYDVADQCALELGRAARFAPSSRPTVGQIIFNWHTVAPPATNLPAVP
jgi:hypothetical protein